MRLFVAVDIPDAVRDGFTRLTDELRKACPAARPIKWARLEDAHVTLKFIGEVPDGQSKDIAEALRQAKTVAPFELVFAGLGFFPEERRPRVLWAGIEGGSALAGLAVAVEDALAPLGISREARPFRPHVTLARLEPSPEIAALRAAVAARGTPEFGRTTVREFSLFRSVPKKAGAEYTRLGTYPLSGDQVS